jgi:hypothetical protein
MAVSKHLILVANEHGVYHSRIVDGGDDPESYLVMATRGDCKRDDIRVIPLDAVLALPYRRAEVTVRIVEYDRAQSMRDAYEDDDAACDLERDREEQEADGRG